MTEVSARVENRIHPLLQKLIDSPEYEPVFWAEVEALGAPLLEPDPDSNQHTYVTFVAQLPAEAHHLVIQPGGFQDPPGSVMTPVIGTRTVWACYRYRNDVRLHYSLASDMPLVSWRDANQEEIDQINSSFLTASKDPFNRREIQLQSRTVSLLALPNAPDESLITKRSGIKRGRLEEMEIHSEILKEQRKVWIYQPSVPQKPVKLLLVLDGGWYLSLIPTHRILDNLSADSLIPPTTAIFIDTPPGTRDADLCYNEQFARFVAEELIPWARTTYSFANSPQDVCVAGSSLGGLFSMWLGHTYPDVIGNIICQAGVIAKFSGPNQPQVEEDKLIKLFQDSEPLPLRIWLEVGLMDDVDTIVDSTRRMRAVLKEKLYELTYHEFAGGHDFALWRGTFAQALKTLLRVES